MCELITTGIIRYWFGPARKSEIAYLNGLEYTLKLVLTPVRPTKSGLAQPKRRRREGGDGLREYDTRPPLDVGVLVYTASAIYVSVILSMISTLS